MADDGDKLAMGGREMKCILAASMRMETMNQSIDIYIACS